MNEVSPGGSAAGARKDARQGAQKDGAAGDEEQAALELRIAQARELAGRFATTRLIAFGAAIAGLALSYYASPAIGLALLAPAAAAYAFAFYRHGSIEETIEALETQRDLREEFLARRKRKTNRHPPERPDQLRESSVHTSDIRHPTSDIQSQLVSKEPAQELDRSFLDDFDLDQGPRSLLGFLDATSTYFGARKLIELLRRPLLEARAIRERQESVRALAADGARRSRLLAALHRLRRYRFDPVPGLLASPCLFSGKFLLTAWARLSATAGMTSLILTAIDFRFGAILTLCLVLNLFTIARLASRLHPARDRLLALGPFLDGLASTRAALGPLPPGGTALLAAAAGRIASLEAPARRLRRWIRLLAFHELGILFEALNLLLLWELNCVPSGERILDGLRGPLAGAGGALGEIEALLCLSLPLVEEAPAADGGEPGFILPEILEEPAPRFEAIAFAHPLLEPGRRVANDLVLDAARPMAIITGSNMAGKSTLLRAVGTNLVLAQAGGPVLARSFRATPLSLQSDINIRDSLDDGRSYFAVEVDRVREILRRAGEGPFLLAIFDELFRGTNSAERQAIALALLAHLRAAGGLHLVATHDLSITRLAEELPGVTNHHLREEVDGGAMRFDYRLRPGPAPTRNAIRVLEARGYPSELVRQARERLAKLEG